MKFKDIKEHNDFKKGQIVNCMANDRGSTTRPDVHLIVNKLYTVIDTDIKGYMDRKIIDVYVENDNDIVEKYSSKRFKIDREVILSELLD